MDGVRATYAEIDAASARVANALVRDGVRPGDLAAVYSRNSADAFVAALGIVRAGAVWLPINARSSTDLNVATLIRFGCRVVLHQAEYTDAVERAVAEIDGDPVIAALPSGHDRTPWEAWLGDADTTPPRIDLVGSDLLALPQTGGTTGVPKGVMLSHRNFCALAYGMRLTYGGRIPVLLVGAPMTHVGGRIALCSLTAGARTVVIDGLDPATVLRTIEAERVTDTFAPPTALYSLIEHPDVETADTSSLVSISYGSAPISVPRLKEAIGKLGPVLRNGYGQTECPMLITRFTPEDHFVDADPSGPLRPDDELGTVGRATDLSTVAIVDDDANPLPPGTRGEIAVKGPMVSEGYWQDPAATAAIRRNGWHLTGDIGEMDTDGYLRIVDRKKDMIISGGFNVYSADVETALNEHPAVAMSAVIGVPSDRWGEAVKAFVVALPDAVVGEAELIEHCRSRLGSVMAPKSIDVVDDLPRTPVGKLDKKSLRAPFWVDTDRSI